MFGYGCQGRCFSLALVFPRSPYRQVTLVLAHGVGVKNCVAGYHIYPVRCFLGSLELRRTTSGYVKTVSVLDWIRFHVCGSYHVKKTTNRERGAVMCVHVDCPFGVSLAEYVPEAWCFVIFQSTRGLLRRFPRLGLVSKLYVYSGVHEYQTWLFRSYSSIYPGTPA